MPAISSRKRDQGDSTHSPRPLPTGVRLRDEYRVDGVLGAGSFGITYRASDEHLNTTVAIKEYYPGHIAGRSEDTHAIRPHSPEDQNDFAFGLEEFMQEGRRIARFDHPNIVDVRSYFEQHGTGYLVMDYYEGWTLAEHIARNGGRLSEAEAVDLMWDVLEGLRPVHEDGLLHRDIDPQNIYLKDGASAMLIDFGAAREVVSTRGQEIEVILKSGYAPYEQYLSDGSQGPHTDIYACAATLYKCLTGLRPPRALDRIESDELVSPREITSSVSVETSVAVMKGLSLNPDRRPASVQDFAALLGDSEEPTSTEMSETAVPDTEEVRSDSNEFSSETEVRAAIEEYTADQPDQGRPVSPSADASGPARVKTLGMLLGGTGIVGGTLMFSDVGFVEVLSFFGTWIAVCVGLLVLFREGEKVMSGESRAAVSDWLLRENFAVRQSNWPKTFVALFDALFTKKHLSWVCFRRSALTSVLVITLLFVGFLGFGLLTAPTSLSGLAEIGMLLGIPIALNVVIDYASLFETRWILGRMGESEHSFVHLLYLGIDLVLTGLCVILPVSILQIFGLGVMTEFSMLSSAFWYQMFSALLNMAELFITFTEAELGQIPRVMSVMLFSTLFTSVWVWLYVVSGALLRVIRPVLEGLNWLKYHLNVEARPVHAMGMLLAVLVSMGFAISAPFVL